MRPAQKKLSGPYLRLENYYLGGAPPTPFSAAFSPSLRPRTPAHHRNLSSQTRTSRRPCPSNSSLNSLFRTVIASLYLRLSPRCERTLRGRRLGQPSTRGGPIDHAQHHRTSLDHVSQHLFGPSPGVIDISTVTRKPPVRHHLGGSPSFGPFPYPSSPPPPPFLSAPRLPPRLDSPFPRPIRYSLGSQLSHTYATLHRPIRRLYSSLQPNPHNSAPVSDYCYIGKHGPDNQNQTGLSSSQGLRVRQTRKGISRCPLKAPLKGPQETRWPQEARSSRPPRLDVLSFFRTQHVRRKRLLGRRRCP